MTAPDHVLEIYTIIHRPVDLPGVIFAVRTDLISPGLVTPGPLLGTAGTLADARALIPPTADTCISRSPQDQRGVVESWL